MSMSLHVLDCSEVFSTFVVQADKRWWFEYPAKNPASMGFDTALVQTIEDTRSMAGLEPNIPELWLDAPPFGADCGKYKVRGEYGCHGCPTTNAAESFAWRSDETCWQG
jgi:hypothetical protein